MKQMKDMPYHRGIKFRAYMSTEQQKIAGANLGAARFIYNRLVIWNDQLYRMKKVASLVPAYRSRIEYLEAALRSATGLKNAIPFLFCGIDSQMIADTIANYHKAWKMFRTMPGTGIPTTRKFSYDRSYQTSPHYPKEAKGLNSGNVKLVDRHHLQFPILGKVKISGSPDRIQFLMENAAYMRFGTITVSVDEVSRYYISVQLGSTIPFVKDPPKTGKAVGIDMNVENFFADSDGNIVGSPKHRRGFQKDLVKTQRRLSRRRESAKAEGRPLRTSKNYVESFFSKMTKQMLKGIRVKPKEELIQRIYTYFDEINAEPVVFHWTWHLDDIDPTESIKTETLLEMSS